MNGCVILRVKVLLSPATSKSLRTEPGWESLYDAEKNNLLYESGIVKVQLSIVGNLNQVIANLNDIGIIDYASYDKIQNKGLIPNR